MSVSNIVELAEPMHLFMDHDILHVLCHITEPRVAIGKHLDTKVVDIRFPYHIYILSFHFYSMNALVYVVIDQGIHKIRMKVAQNEKRIKTMCFFFFYGHSHLYYALNHHFIISF